MRVCRVCGRNYDDDTSYCLQDGSVLAPAAVSQGFISSQPVKTGSSPILYVLGGILLLIFVAGGLFVALLWAVVRNPADAANTNNKKQPISVPAASPRVNNTPDYANANNYPSASDDSTKSDTPSPSPTKPAASDVDFSEGVTFTGKAINETVSKSDSVRVRVTGSEDKYRAEGGLGNKNLFGKLENVNGERAICPGNTGKVNTCLQFNGKLAFGNDGSNFPPGTKAPFAMFLIVDKDTGIAAGAYQIGIIPGYASLGKQKGKLIFTQSSKTN